MGGGAKSAVLDDKAIEKRRRDLKNGMGRSLVKKTMNTQKERNKVLGRSAYQVGGIGMMDGVGIDGIMGVQQEISVLEHTNNLAGFVSLTLAAPQDTYESLVLRKKDREQIEGTHTNQGRTVVEGHDDGMIGEFNSIQLPRRPLGLVSADQVIIERAIAAGYCYKVGMEGDGVGTEAYCQSKGFCTCRDLQSCALGNLDFMHAIPYGGPVVGSKDVKGVLEDHDGFTTETKAEEFLANTKLLPWEIPIDYLRRIEVNAFVEWRRNLTGIEEKEGTLVTPYEKNIEYWRQFWRVIEGTDLVIQVLDGRDPLFFFSPDVIRMAKRADPLKKVMIVINKADYLPQSAREQWKEFFAGHGLDVVFFSALSELIKIGHTTVLGGTGPTIQKPDNRTGNIGGFRAAVSRSISEEMMSSDDGRDEESYQDFCYSSSDSEDYNVANQQTVNVGIGKETGVDIMDAKNMRQYLCEKRVELMPLLQRRRDVVTLISDYAKIRAASKEHPEFSEWKWWRNGVATKAYGVFQKQQEELAEKQKETTDLKTMKAMPNWQVELKIREQLIQEAVDTKILARHGKGIGLTKEPKLPETEFKMGTVGYPNVGKSSLINALLLGVGSTKGHRLAVSATPGKTKHFQSMIIPLELDENPAGLFDPSLNIPLRLLDCPGLVYPSIVSSKNTLILNGVVRIGQMKGDRFSPVQTVIKRCAMQMPSRYGVSFLRIKPSPLDPSFPEAAMYCNEVAIKKGYSKGKGQKGEGDSNRVALNILDDYCRGFLLFFHRPPGCEETPMAPPLSFKPETVVNSLDLFSDSVSLFDQKDPAALFDAPAFPICGHVDEDLNEDLVDLKGFLLDDDIMLTASEKEIATALKTERRKGMLEKKQGKKQGKGQGKKSIA